MFVRSYYILLHTYERCFYLIEKKILNSAVILKNKQQQQHFLKKLKAYFFDFYIYA